MSLSKFLFDKKQDQPSKESPIKPIIPNLEIDPKINKRSTRYIRIVSIVTQLQDNIVKIEHELKYHTSILKVQSLYQELISKIFKKSETRRDNRVSKAKIKAKSDNLDEYDTDDLIEKAESWNEFDATTLTELKGFMKKIDLSIKQLSPNVDDYFFSRTQDYSYYKNRKEAWQELSNYIGHNYEKMKEANIETLEMIKTTPLQEIATSLLKQERSVIQENKESIKLDKEEFDFTLDIYKEMKSVTNLEDLDHSYKNYKSKKKEFDDISSKISMSYYNYHPDQDLSYRFQTYLLNEQARYVTRWYNKVHSALSQYKDRHTKPFDNLYVDTLYKEQKEHLEKIKSYEDQIASVNLPISTIQSFEIDAPNTPKSTYFQVHLLPLSTKKTNYYRKTDAGYISKSSKKTFLTNLEKGKQIVLQNFEKFKENSYPTSYNGIAELKTQSEIEFPSEKHKNNAFIYFKTLFQIEDDRIGSDDAKYILMSGAIALMTHAQTESIFYSSSSYSLPLKEYSTKGDNSYYGSSDENTLVLTNSKNNIERYFMVDEITQIGQFLGYKKDKSNNLSIIQQMLNNEVIQVPDDQYLPAIITHWDHYNIISAHLDVEDD